MISEMLRLLILAGIATHGNGFLASLFQYHSNNNCTENQFNCINNVCIQKEKRCDGVEDCSDMSDEMDCDYILCRDPMLFKCKNDRCISKSFVCDGENDCDDYSDEENCTNFKFKHSNNVTCEENEWKCSDNLCILKDWVCNGEPDCLDGSDETIGCTLTIPCDGFKCKNGHCVPQEWRCDGFNDCIDNSDEEECENYINPKKCTWENKKFLCSNNQTCIDMKHVCDSKPHCPDKSDESDLCTSLTSSCATHNCSHTCVQLPTGPKCYCPDGYRNINEKECHDINECEIYGICDQKCRNSPGSYECYCADKFTLQDDGKTCKADGGEPMMIFSSKNEIRAYFMRSKLYFPVANQLHQVVGVAYDGDHVYWTDILSEHESIVKSLEDGSERELLVTSGLGSPEDIAIDHLTRNIYFTDAEFKHIGVCTKDGRHCTVIINKDIRKPRGIALNIEEGEMFWTDWGHPAEIARSNMDGSDDHPFVTEDIHWPNGLTIDYPNERLYWTDAKVMTLESIKLDGTDRRIVLEAVVKHPYSIAVFENRLYWSDWHTHTIQSCDKFTGKDHHTIIKEKKEFIYGLDIYHSSKLSTRDNPCSMAFCSDICLLKGSTSYRCACPQNKNLSSDHHTCKEIERRQVLVFGAKHLLVHIEHQLLGKHTVIPLPIIVKDVGALAYDPMHNILYISDLGIKKIIQLNMTSGSSKPLNIEDLGKVTSMDYDYNGNNLYLGDEDKGVVEIINVKNMAKKTILHDMHNEIPEAIAVIPASGVMFIAFKRKSDHISHIDRFFMDGTGRTHIMDQGIIGPISFHYDRDLNRLFFADAGTGNIETTSIDGDDRHQFSSPNTNPASITALKLDLFWVNEHSKRLYWSNKYTGSHMKRVPLDMFPENLNRMHLISATPESFTIFNGGCTENNGNCSHLCIPSQKSIICSCPNNMMMSNDNLNCIEKTYCEITEFKCPKTNLCIPQVQRCNGIPECTFGEDEEDCKPENHCPIDFFMCDDGECINDHKVCNSVFDCKDRSDEQKCSSSNEKLKCPPQHFQCSSGICIPEKFVCDGFGDCADNSDEMNCTSSTCSSTQFRCDSGSCIPKSWECDHEHDCLDMSDEHPNCPSTCGSDFTCNNRKCVDRIFVCDSTDDCGDNSDEFDCNSTLPTPCKSNEFQCSAKSTVCIPTAAVCNGTSECPGQEDEYRCSDCNVDEFMCLNKKCIPRLWTCDHTDDCGDGSDEKPEACNEEKTELHIARVEIPCNGFRCKSGHCLDESLVCNGQPDCYDGTDEGGLCKTSCDTVYNPCEQLCLRTPTGPTCRCRKGYGLKGDGKTCIDIDECKREPPVCSQLCFNHPGKFQCDCYFGFELRSDKISCKAQGNPMSLFFTSNNQVRQLSQKENKLKLVYSEETAKITGLAYSLRSNDLYMSIENTGTILKINEKSNTKDIIDNVGQPKKLALDWVTNNIYFYNTVPYSRSIDVCNFEDKSCAQLIKTDLHSQILNLAVDPINRFLFYTITSWFIFNSPRYVIYKSHLDGTGKQAIVLDSPGHVTGLAFDWNKKQLYYVDQHTGSINRVNYDGTMKQTVHRNVTNPMGLAFYENHVYYLSSGGLMHKYQLFDLNEEQTFKLDVFNGGLFTIVQESLQPRGLDVCANHTCSYLCVPSKKDFRCLCEDGQVVGEKEECPSKTRSSDDDDRRRYIMKKSNLKEDVSGTSNVFLLSLCLVILIILVIGLGAYYLRRRKNSGGMNIGISFHNATYGRDDVEKSTILTPGRHEYTNPVDFDPTELQSTADTVMEKSKPLLVI